MIRSLALAATLSLVVACGSSRSDSCAPSFTRDYNALLTQSADALTRTDAENFQASVSSFRVKYGGVVCKVLAGDQIELVDVNAKTTEWLNSPLPDEVAMTTAVVETCSAELVTDYNATMDQGIQVLSVATAQTFRANLVALQAKYPGAVCLTKVRGTTQKIDIDAKTSSLIQQVDGALSND